MHYSLSESPSRNQKGCYNLTAIQFSFSPSPSPFCRSFNSASNSVPKQIHESRRCNCTLRQQKALLISECLGRNPDERHNLLAKRSRRPLPSPPECGPPPSPPLGFLSHVSGSALNKKDGRTDGLMSEWIPEDSEAEFVSPLAAITSLMEAPKNSNVSNKVLDRPL